MPFAFLSPFFSPPTAWCLHLQLQHHPQPSLREKPMDSLPSFLLQTASVCLTCGDRGEADLLVYCMNCPHSAVHRYCMDNFDPDDININWSCWDCELKDAKAEALRKSDRISSKRQKNLETRYYWKEKLNQKKREVQISNEISERGPLTTDGNMSNWDMETKLVNERQKDQDNLEKDKFVPEIDSHSQEHNESIKIDEPPFGIDCTLPPKQENNMMSFDETQKTQEVGQEITLLLRDDANSQSEGKSIDPQLSSLVDNDHSSTSDKLCKQSSLEPCPSAEPVNHAIWRGWFGITNERKTSIEILAHLSSKACSKVSNAATAMAPILDIQLLEKNVLWPKSFRIDPPTPASIALYFFPASERDEKAYDSLVDEVIEGDMALKVMIDDIELLIFSSRELPLPHWRYNSKYYLWGVFKKTKQHSRSSTQQHDSIPSLRHSETTVMENSKDMLLSQYSDGHMSPPTQSDQSPLSMKSSQASNMFLPSNHNTPNSLASLSFVLKKISGTKNESV